MLRALIVLIVLGAIGYWYWTTTPEYSMRQVKQAVKQHDLVKFEKYTDEDSVAAGIVDDLLADPMRQILGPSTLGQWLVAGIVGVIKPPLARGVKADIRRFVTTGRFTEPDSDVDSSSDQDGARFSLGGMDSRFGFRKHAFRRVEYSRKDGKTCLLGLLFHNEVYDKDLVLEVKMQDYGGYWKLTEITNFPKFMAKLIEWQAGRAQANSADSETRQPAGQL